LDNSLDSLFSFLLLLVPCRTTAPRRWQRFRQVWDNQNLHCPTTIRYFIYTTLDSLVGFPGEYIHKLFDHHSSPGQDNVYICGVAHPPHGIAIVWVYADAGPSVTPAGKSKTQPAATPEVERPQEGESLKLKQGKEKRKRQGESVEKQGKKKNNAASVQQDEAVDKRQGETADVEPKGGAPSTEKKRKKKQSGGPGDRRQS
jgi:hypothetical protein